MVSEDSITRVCRGPPQFWNLPPQPITHPLHTGDCLQFSGTKGPSGSHRASCEWAALVAATWQGAGRVKQAEILPSILHKRAGQGGYIYTDAW